MWYQNVPCLACFNPLVGTPANINTIWLSGVYTNLNLKQLPQSITKSTVKVVKSVKEAVDSAGASLHLAIKETASPEGVARITSRSAMVAYAPGGRSNCTVTSPRVSPHASPLASPLAAAEEAAADALDLDGMADADHAHAPYVLVLAKLAKAWRVSHGGASPKTREN